MSLDILLDSVSRFLLNLFVSSFVYQPLGRLPTSGITTASLHGENLTARRYTGEVIGEVIFLEIIWLYKGMMKENETHLLSGTRRVQ